MVDCDCRKINSYQFFKDSQADIDMAVDMFKELIADCHCYELDSWQEEWYCDHDVEILWFCTDNGVTFRSRPNEGCDCLIEEDDEDKEQTMPTSEVLNLATGEIWCYTLEPHDALVHAVRQSRGDYSWWRKGYYDVDILETEQTLFCGDWSVKKQEA